MIITRKNQNRTRFPQNSYGVHTWALYGLAYRLQTEMKLFLDDNRFLGLSLHVNYKDSGLVLSELWIFEV